MKRTTLLLVIFLYTIASMAQTQEWTSPFVGYTSIDKLTVDKVELLKNKTLMDVTVKADSGYTFWIAKDAYLSAEGKRYALKKVTPIGTEKHYTLPKSDKVHFTMQFEPLPTDTKRFHFVEGESRTGWRLCNICQNKEVLATEMPTEWQNVEYADVKTLPESRLCDDSTTINVKILNYVPEAGKYLSAFITPISGDDMEYYHWTHINENGTATMKLHPCFPQTVQMRIEQDKFFYILVMPGEDVSVLLDLGKGGTNPTMAFKGALAKVNYEVNLLADSCRIPFPSSDAYFELLLRTNHRIPCVVTLRDALRKIRGSNFCGATKEWLELDTDQKFVWQTRKLNQYLREKLRKELESTGSTLLKNTSVRTKVEELDAQWCMWEITNHRSGTLCPNFAEVWLRRPSENGNVRNTYNVDILYLIEALGRNRVDSYEKGLKIMESAKDSTIKAFYFVTAKRWQQYVDSINHIPHLHFDQHQGLKDEELKKALLADYRGKNVVLLFYDRNKKEHLRDLKELEPLMAKTDSQRVVFLHIDVALSSIASWMAAAQQHTGEHYNGIKTRYDYMSSNYDRIHSTFHCEFYAPDGTQTLSTDDAKEAIKAIEKLVE